MKLAITQIILGALVLVCGITMFTFIVQDMINENTPSVSYTFQAADSDKTGNITITFPTGTFSGNIVTVPQEKVYPVSFGVSLAIACILPLVGLAIIICSLLQVRKISKNRQQASILPQPEKTI
jgi:hypothetical protein